MPAVAEHIVRSKVPVAQASAVFDKAAGCTIPAIVLRPSKPAGHVLPQPLAASALMDDVAPTFVASASTFINAPICPVAVNVGKNTPAEHDTQPTATDCMRTAQEGSGIRTFETSVLGPWAARAIERLGGKTQSSSIIAVLLTPLRVMRTVDSGGHCKAARFSTSDVSRPTPTTHEE